MKRFFSLMFTLCIFMACDIPQPSGQTHSASGVTQARVQVPTDLNGSTIEQNNIKNRLLEDNKPGAIKHLYIISAYSGDVIMYSTVKGKVTSAGKRLSPTSVLDNGNSAMRNTYGFDVDIDGSRRTTEVLQDDGTYGTSVEYVYWWDSKGIYHQQYITGGMMMHISSQPIAVKKVIINLETDLK